MDIPARVWHCIASPKKNRKDDVTMNDHTCFTHVEAATLIAHEAVILLDAV